jgi:hypothetical protein
LDVESEDGGSGLVGKCHVDEFGTVQSVEVTAGGQGYGPNTRIKCTREAEASAEASTAELDFDIVRDSGVLASAAQWRRSTGTLKLAVCYELTGLVKFSFTIRNSMSSQEKKPAFIMASGATPIGSALLTGDVMEISGTSITVTKVCAVGSGAGSKKCVSSFTNLPTETGAARPYTLSAEIQCNGGVEGLTVKVGGDSGLLIEEEQPPPTCVDSCNDYHRLFSDVDLSSKVANSELSVQYEYTTAHTDHCGAGDVVKVIFILNY